MSAPIPCGCPITKTLTVNFTGSTPAPSNGYIVKWAIPNGPFNFVSPNPTSSPVTIPNVPACETVTVVMQSQCDNSQVSAEQTTTVPGATLYDCGDTITASNTHNGFYIYPPYILDVRGATADVSLTYDVIDKPNRITVYDDLGNLVITTGWRGVAAYSGPWGATLNTPTTGVITFTKSSGKCFYKLLIESSTNVSFQDSLTINISCPTTVAPVTPTITYESCFSGSGSYRVDAPSSTALKIKLTASGSLTNNSTSGYCAMLDGAITSSTGQSDTEVSPIVTTTGNATIGDSNSLFVNVTIPGAGYLVINTSVFTVNSLATSTTAALTIFEVNGSAANITQAVCVESSTGVVSCGSPTYTNYLATRYVCGSCVQEGGNDAYIVAFANGISVVQGKFYVPSSGSGEMGTYVYLIGAQTTNGPGLIMQNSSSTTCSGACSIIP